MQAHCNLRCYMRIGGQALPRRTRGTRVCRAKCAVTCIGRVGGCFAALLWALRSRIMWRKVPPWRNRPLSAPGPCLLHLPFDTSSHLMGFWKASARLCLRLLCSRILQAQFQFFSKLFRVACSYLGLCTLCSSNNSSNNIRWKPP